MTVTGPALLIGRICAGPGIAVMLAAHGTAMAAKQNEARETFTDFQVTCDSDRTCRAGTAADPPGGELRLTRDEPNGRHWVVTFKPTIARLDPVRPLNFRIDDAPPTTLLPGTGYAAMAGGERYYLVAGRLGDRLFKQLIKGRQLRIEFIDVVGAPHDLVFSLLGLSAALDHIDARQHRSAAPRRVASPSGDRRDPEAARQSAIVDLGVPDKVYAIHAQIAPCEDPTSNSLKSVAPITAIVAPTAILYAIPCYIEAGNTAYRLYAVDTGEIGGIRPLLFADFSRSHGWTGRDVLHNVVYEAAAGRLSSTVKGRRSGDCGSVATWLWKNHDFALESYRFWPHCDGSRKPAEWPVIYPPAQ